MGTGIHLSRYLLHAIRTYRREQKTPDTNCHLFDKNGLQIPSGYSTPHVRIPGMACQALERSNIWLYFDQPGKFRIICHHQTCQP